MSGYKHATVTISEAEYRRLHQADMKRRFREHAKAKGKGSRNGEQLVKTVQQIEDRQRQLEQALMNLDQNFDRMEAEAVHEILRQNALCYDSLLGIIEETTLNTDDSLALISQRFTEELQSEREHHAQNFQSLLQQLNTYEEREEFKTEAARYWLRQAVAFAGFIQEGLDHERFLPGRLNRVLGSLDFAQNNLEQGFLESSLQTSQQALLQLSELHLELEQRIVEWQAEYERACSALAQFVVEMETNARVNAFGLDGEALAEQVDLNFWSNGKYAHLLDKCRHLLTLLSQDHQHISTEELRRTHTELLPVVTASFESIIYEARLDALNSQLRMNIAEQALQALEIHGFTLNESGYENEDMRAPFLVRLGNADGSNVTIQVLPTDQARQDLTNELVVITNHPHLRTEQEARLQWEELARSLQQFHLRVSRPEVLATAPLSVPEPMAQPAPVRRQLIHAERQNDVR